MGPLVFGLVVTIVVMVAIAVFVAVFERRRAREIETDAQRLPGGFPRNRKGNVHNGL